MKTILDPSRFTTTNSEINRIYNDSETLVTPIYEDYKFTSEHWNPENQYWNRATKGELGDGSWPPNEHRDSWYEGISHISYKGTSEPELLMFDRVLSDRCMPWKTEIIYNGTDINDIDTSDTVSGGND